MYINQNSLQYKHFQDFEKYVQFICESFDIKVVLDATRAETDGKVIYLPNVMSLTKKELDMMYAILLHEAGHIRYSTFEDSYFKALKSVSHAALANAIEDARIENLLMKDFAGAEQMFESLYCDYVQDKELMKKVFKHTGANDLFSALSFNIHNKLLQCNTPALKEIVGTAKASRINKFWKKNDIDTIIAKNPLKLPKDVLTLTNIVYDLFVKDFADESEKLDFAKEEKEKNKINKEVEALKKKALEVEEQVQSLKEKLKETEQEIQLFNKEHASQYSDLRYDKSDNEEKLNKVLEKLIGKIIMTKTLKN